MTPSTNCEAERALRIEPLHLDGLFSAAGIRKGKPPLRVPTFLASVLRASCVRLAEVSPAVILARVALVRWQHGKDLTSGAVWGREVVGTEPKDQ